MILIADSGATKTQWGCVNRDGSCRQDFFSQGYNPNYISVLGQTFRRALTRMP